MNVMLLLLFLLVASPSKAKGLDSLVYVGPIVNSVVVGSKTLEPEGDFFRAVLANSEYDPCLRVERVNVRAPNAPRVKASLRYCAVTFGKERLSLAASEQQEAEPEPILEGVRAEPRPVLCSHRSGGYPPRPPLHLRSSRRPEHDPLC